MVDQNSKDLFGKLPDEILSRIIAFLPSETALETSFLSTRWRELWNFASVKQSCLDGIANEVTEFIAEFDNSDPLRLPRKLRLHLGHGYVLLASLAPINKLKVELFFEDKLVQECLRPFCSKLKLLSHQNGINSLSSSASFVKTLHLKSVESLTNDSISSMFSRFRFLERLKIAECNGLKSLRIEAGTKLASLTVLDCPNLVFLHLECSKLRSFCFRGKLPKIWPERHFNLADAMLDFRLGLGDESLVGVDFDPALLTIKNSRVLTLCSWTFETLIWPSVCPLKVTFQFYKLKELWWIGYSEEQSNTNSLILFLELCPGLERLFVTIDAKSFGQRNPGLCSEKAFRHVKNGKLKVLKMEGFLNQENEIRLAKKVREIFSVEPLVIYSTSSEYESGNIIVESPTPTHAQLAQISV